MLKKLFVVLGLSMIVGESSVCAQSAQLAQGTADVGRGSGIGTITVQIQNASIPDAIARIEKLAGQTFTYEAAALPAARRVTYTASNVTAMHALENVLRGTGFKVANTAGRIRLIPPVVQKDGTVQGVVSGRVVDAKTGKGVAGANVSVGNDTRGTATSADGSYRITGVATGTHVVSVRLVGYAKQSRSVTIGEGVTVVADFKLEPSTNVLDRVVVTGTVVSTELKAVPNAITIITAKQIEERGITRIDQLFRGDIPGLYAVNQGSSSALDKVLMYSRGITNLAPGASSGGSSNTNPIKTYIDGVEMVDPSYLSQIDPRSIERIEVLTGPQASTIYGSNAINGVMQIFTKRGLSARPQVTATLLSGWIQNNFTSALTPQHDYSGQMAGTEGRLSYNIGGSWLHTGRWSPGVQNNKLNSFNGVRVQTGLMSADISFRFSNTLNSSHGASSQGTSHRLETGVYGPYQGMGLAAYSNSQVNGQTFGLTLGYTPTSWWSHEALIGSDVSTQATRYLTTAYVSPSDTLFFLSESRGRRNSGRYNTTIHATFTSQATATLTLGGDAWRYASTGFSTRTLNLTGTLGGTPTVTRQLAKNAGGFFQTQIGFYDQLFLTYGLRAEWNPNYGKEAQPNIAPRYGMAYTHDLGFITAKARASYGRSTRPPAAGLRDSKTAIDAGWSYLVPDYGNIEAILANPVLNPEFQRGGEGGIELYFGNISSFSVTRYNQVVDNIIFQAAVDSARSIVPNPSCCATAFRDAEGYGYTSVYQWVNAANINNRGWEAQGSLGISAFTVRGTYSWTQSRTIGVVPELQAFFAKNKANYRQFQPGATFPYIAEHTWALGVTYAHQASTVGLNWSGIGKLKRSTDELYNNHLVQAVRILNDRYLMSTIPYVNFGGAYAIADLNAVHRFSGKVEGVLQVQNLMNYYESDFLEDAATMGRQTKIGMRIRM